MIILNTEEKKIREEQEKVKQQVNAARAGYMGMRSAIDSRGRLVSEVIPPPTIFRKGEQFK